MQGLSFENNTLEVSFVITWCMRRLIRQLADVRAHRTTLEGLENGLGPFLLSTTSKTSCGHEQSR